MGMKEANQVDINFIMKPNFLLHLLFPACLLFTAAGIKSEELPDRINFGKSAMYGRFITASELSIWGSSRNLKLLEDCPFRDMTDFEAEVIPVHGMSFVLNAPGTGRVYLYLDLVTFLPLDKYESYEEDYCSQESENIRFSESESLLPGIRWLEVLVNGKSIKTIYAGDGIYLNSPVVIAVDRENAMRRRLEITLRPSPGETFFGIWDAFTLKSRISDEQL